MNAHQSASLHLLLVLTFLLGIGLPTTAAANPGTDESRLTVPWDEFKRLLDLDSDQIALSIETFHKLVSQATNSAPPAYTTQDENVIMSRSAFESLVSQMKDPIQTGVDPPFDHLITKAVYSGRMEQDNTLFTGIFHVHVLADHVYLKVPILPQMTALEDIQIDDQPALVVRENGYHNVVLSSAGEHEVKVTFSVRSSLQQGPHQLELAIVETPITLLRLDLPLNDVAVQIQQAQQLSTAQDGERTVVSAVVTPGRQISIQWRDGASAVAKIPPKLYSEIHHLVSIEDDILRVSSNVTYNVLHSEIDQVFLAVPDGTNVLSISGAGLGEWQEVPDTEDNRVRVPFTYGRKGAFSIHVVTEGPLGEETALTEFSGIRALDTVREIGLVGIEVKTSAEVTVEENVGLEPIGVPKLPAALQSRAVKPIMHGFKYVKHPCSLAFSIRKHEKIAVPVAAITSGNAVTLFTEDGKIVYRVVYEVKNSAKQFLEVDLPEDADVWTVFVDHQPVESALNKEGKMLVPLIRSRVVDNGLASFPVEIVYCLVRDQFSLLDARQAVLPPVDLLISQLIWSVYLPNDYEYVHFTSTLEKEEMIRGFQWFAGGKRHLDGSAIEAVELKPGVVVDGDVEDRLEEAYQGGDYKSRFKNLPIGEAQLSSQVAAELDFGRKLNELPKESASGVSTTSGAGGAGVLPIQIQVPTGGQVYRFARTIVRPEDNLEIGVTYSANWLINVAKWSGIVMFLGWVYLMRRNFLRALTGIRRSAMTVAVSILEFLKGHEAAGKKIAESIMTPVVLLGLLGPIWAVSKPLAVLIVFGLWVSVVYQIVLRSRRKQLVLKQEKP